MGGGRALQDKGLIKMYPPLYKEYAADSPLQYQAYFDAVCCQ